MIDVTMQQVEYLLLRRPALHDFPSFTLQVILLTMIAMILLPFFGLLCLLRLASFFNR